MLDPVKGRDRNDLYEIHRGKKIRISMRYNIYSHCNPFCVFYIIMFKSTRIPKSVAIYTHNGRIYNTRSLWLVNGFNIII